jgi:predicted Zn-dependent protease
MKRVALRVWPYLLLAVMISCATVPITGRRQLAFIPTQQLLSMSYQTYDQYLQQAKVIDDPQKVAMVNRVGNNIRQAVEEFLQAEGEADILRGYDWEFSLVEDEAANAFVLPGGKVVVHTGLLPVAQDDTGLAVVMGHEIAHAIAGHGNERMSQALTLQLGGMALSQALSSYPQQTQQLFMAAFGAGAQIGVLLPYSRLQESEADHLGLIFMAMAGYDPQAAIPFWERMLAQQRERAAPPEFLSTHPPGERRIEEIRDLLPEVMPYYRPGECEAEK